MAGARIRERTFCAREMQHWFPPAEHKQPAEWLVGPHSRMVLIGFCVGQEAGWKVISWALPDDECLSYRKHSRFLQRPEFSCHSKGSGIFAVHIAMRFPEQVCCIGFTDQGILYLVIISIIYLVRKVWTDWLCSMHNLSNSVMIQYNITNVLLAAFVGL